VSVLGVERTESWLYVADGRGPASREELGRVALLYCRCGDLDCRTLSARIVVNEVSVEWRDIGWQVGHGPFDFADQVGRPAHAVFDREAYEELLVDLLSDQWTSRLAEPQS